jgi:hypothetical protein
MPASNQHQLLRVALIAFGLIFTFGIYPLSMFWPSGWAWEPAQPQLFQMILAVYATLGVFLLFASREPERHTSLLWFTVWSSAVHAVLMAVQAFSLGHMGHMLGDVAALTLVAVTLSLLMPKARVAAT